MTRLYTAYIFLNILFLCAFISTGCSSSSSDKQPKIPGLDLSFTAGSPGNQNVAADAQVSISHIHLEASGSGDVSISSITLNATGTGDDEVDIQLVEIYLDVDDSDSFDIAVDELIGSGSFDADDGKLEIDFASQQLVSPGPGRNWIIRYQLSGMGPDGATYSFTIDRQTDVVVRYLSGPLTTTSGLPAAASVLTISSGGAKLNLLEGPNPPSARDILKGAINVSALQFTLYNRDSSDITVDSIRVTPSGSGDDSTEIFKGYIYLDPDGDGFHDSLESLFGEYSYSADNTGVDVAGSLVIAPGEKVHMLIAYDFNLATVVGSQFQANIASTNHIQAQDAATNPVIPSGITPLEGAVITVAEKGNLTAREGVNNPDGGMALAGAVNLPVMQVELEAGLLEDLTIDSFSLHSTGSADESADIGQVRLFRDMDGDGAVGTGDINIGEGIFTADNGIVNISGIGHVITAGVVSNLLVTCDIPTTAQAEGSFQFYVGAGSEISTTGIISGLTVNATGIFPINGGSFLTRVPDTFVAAAPLDSARFMHTQTTFMDPGDGKYKVLVCGGFDASDVLSSVEVYNPEDDTWTTLTPGMTKPRMLHTATLLDDGQRILIAGGTDGVVTTYQDGEIFDPATYTFTAIADNMASRRQMHTAVLTDEGDVFYYGGQYIFGSLLFVGVTEYYNQAVNRFDPLGTSHYLRVLHTMNKLSGGTVIVTGGLGFASTGPRTTVLLKSIQLWSTSPSISESLSWLSLAGFGRCGHVAVSMPGGKLLIAGGYNLNLHIYTTPPFSGRKTAEMLKENTSMLGDENISDVGDMSEVRFMPVGALLQTGEVLIAGGTDDSLGAQTLSSAEIFNPGTESFRNSGSTMIQNRYRAKSSMLPGPDAELGTPDDLLLITGGLIEYAPSPGPAQVTASAEVYVP